MAESLSSGCTGFIKAALGLRVVVFSGLGIFGN